MKFMEWKYGSKGKGMKFTYHESKEILFWYGLWMETLIQAFEIQINMVWNQFHGIIHELIRYAHALITIKGRGGGGFFINLFVTQQ